MSRDNQDIKADQGKPQCRLVPPEIIRCIAKVREYGLKKYGSAEICPLWRMWAELIHTIQHNHTLGNREKRANDFLWHLNGGFVWCNT